MFVLQGILQELHKSHDVIKLVTGNLVRSHAAAVTKAKIGLTTDTLTDGKYTHKDVSLFSFC